MGVVVRNRHGQDEGLRPEMREKVLLGDGSSQRATKEFFASLFRWWAVWSSVRQSEDSIYLSLSICVFRTK